jgi:cullin-associated NEDD8-dissociated protein 1
MIILDPAFTLPRVVSLVDEGISEPAANRINVCSTVATSVKFAIAGRANSEVLSKDMPIFLKLLNEDDLGVKNAALLIVYSAVHHDPKLVLGHMQEHILHHLYKVSFHCVYV